MWTNSWSFFVPKYKIPKKNGNRYSALIWKTKFDQFICRKSYYYFCLDPNFWNLWPQSGNSQTLSLTMSSEKQTSDISCPTLPTFRTWNRQCWKIQTTQACGSNWPTRNYLTLRGKLLDVNRTHIFYKWVRKDWSNNWTWFQSSKLKQKRDLPSVLSYRT